jgi:very-short-patch-repair endonuclease
MPRKVLRSDLTVFDAVAEEQSGVLSRSQLRMLGWTHAHLERSVRAGRWTIYGDQAVVLHRGPLTPRQQRWIAIFNGGPAATLAGLTAAEEWGLAGFETPTVHIVVPRGDWVPGRRAGVKVHISRRFTIADRHPARRPPIVSADRAMVDAAVWTPHPRRASALVIAAVQQGLSRPDRLRAELQRAGHVRHRKLLVSVLNDVEGGVRALSELDFSRLCQRHGLPRPELQQRRRDAQGRVRYLDVRFRREDGRVLNVEVDGAAHFGILEAWADMERDIAFLSKGEPTIRVPAVLVRSDPAAVANQIRAVLRARW